MIAAPMPSDPDETCPDPFSPTNVITSSIVGENTFDDIKRRVANGDMSDAANRNGFWHCKRFYEVPYEFPFGERSR